MKINIHPPMLSLSVSYFLFFSFCSSLPHPVSLYPLFSHTHLSFLFSLLPIYPSSSFPPTTPLAFIVPLPDDTKPTVTSVTSMLSDYTDTSKIKLGHSLSFTLNTDSMSVDPVVTFSGGNAVVTGGPTTYSVSYTVTGNEDTGNLLYSVSGGEDAAGLVMDTLTAQDSGIYHDSVAPIANVTSITSSSGNSYAVIGDIITVVVTASEDVSIGSATIAGETASASGGPQVWSFTHTVTGSETDGDGLVTVTFGNIKDVVDNEAASISTSIATDSSSVVIDTVTPTINSVLVETDARLDSKAGVGSVVSVSLSLSELAASSSVSFGPLSSSLTYLSDDGTNFLYSTFFVVSNVFSESSYTIDIDTVSDAAGNSASSASVATITVDLTAPVVSDLTLTTRSGLTNETVAKGTLLEFTFSLSEPVDNAGLVLSTSGVNLSSSLLTFNDASSLSRSGTFLIDDSVPGGNVSLSVLAVDGASNSGSSGEIHTAIFFDIYTPYFKNFSVSTSNVFPNAAQLGDEITFTVIPSEPLEFNLSTVGGYHIDMVEQGDGSLQGTTVVQYDYPEGYVTVDFQFRDMQGNQGLGVRGPVNTLTTDFSFLKVDFTPPEVLSLSISSSNSEHTIAIEDDVITLAFNTSEWCYPPTVYISGIAVTASGSNNNTEWVASRALSASDVEGEVEFSISNFYDVAGNAAPTAYATMDGSSVTYDRTAPSVSVSLTSSTGLLPHFNASTYLTVTVTATEPINTPNFHVDSTSVPLTASSDSLVFTASVLASSLSLSDGDVSFTLSAISDLAGNAASSVTSTASGMSTLSFDSVAPSGSNFTVTSSGVISTSLAGRGDTVSVSFDSDEALSAAVAYIGGAEVVCSGGPNHWEAFLTVDAITFPSPENVTVSVVYRDEAGNFGSPLSLSPGDYLFIDSIPPTISSLSVSSSNAENASWAVVGDVVSFSLEVSESISTPSVFFGSTLISMTASNDLGTTWSAAHTISGSEKEGVFEIQLWYAFDHVGNSIPSPTSTTDGSYLEIDTTAPVMTFVSLSSNGPNSKIAYDKSVVTVTLRSNEIVSIPTVTLNGIAANVIWDTQTGTNGTATLQMDDDAIDVGVLDLVISGFQDVHTLEGALVTSTTDFSFVVYDDTIRRIETSTDFAITTTEREGETSVDVFLNVPPLEGYEAIIDITVQPIGVVVVSPTRLFFSSSNFSSPVTVVVTGSDDDSCCEHTPFSIVLSAAASSDVLYSVIESKSVIAENQNDDGSSILVWPTSGLFTYEDQDGDSASFTVELTAAPTDDVTVTISITQNEPYVAGELSPSSVTFSPSNWEEPVTIRITGQDDVLFQTDFEYTVSLNVTSTDSAYDGFAVSSPVVRHINNDYPPDAARISTIYAVSSSSINLQWQHPAANSYPIDSFQVLVAGPDRSFEQVAQFSGTARSGTVTGLTGDSLYAVAVVATSIAGRSLSFEDTEAYVRTLRPEPEAPKDVTLYDVKATGVSLFWNEPANLNSSVHQYLVELTETSSGSTTVAYKGTDTFVSLSGLRSDVNYTLTVKAKYEFSVFGAASEAVSVVTKLAVPNPIRGLSVSSVDVSSAVLSWTAPSGEQARLVDKVEIEVIYILTGVVVHSSSISDITTVKSLSLSSLSAVSSYAARVRARNAAGRSTWSAFVSFTTINVVPSPPSFSPVAESSLFDFGVNVVWVPEANDEGTPTNLFQLSWMRESEWDEVAVITSSSSFEESVFTKQTSYSISSLNSNTTYVLFVFARNEKGWSAASSRVIITTKLSPPTISSLIASDPDNADVEYSDGDKITITFSESLNVAPTTYLSMSTLDSIFTFSSSIAEAYTGFWVNTSVLEITIQRVGSPAPRLGALLATVNPKANLRSADGHSAAMRGTSPVLTGNWGEQTAVDYEGAFEVSGTLSVQEDGSAVISQLSLSSSLLSSTEVISSLVLTSFSGSIKAAFPSIDPVVVGSGTASVNVTGKPLKIQDSLTHERFVYSPEANSASGDSILATLWVGGVRKVQTNVFVTVSPVNDVPSISLPSSFGSVSADLFVPIGNDIELADVDNSQDPTSPFSLSIIVEQRFGSVLRFFGVSVSDVWYSPPFGQSSSRLTVHGSLSALQSALSGLELQSHASSGDEESVIFEIDDFGSYGYSPYDSLRSASSLSLSVECDPSSLLSVEKAEMSNDLRTLQLSFNATIYGDHSFVSCSEVFDEATLLTLGDNPVCGWTDRTTMTVLLGASASVSTSDELHFSASPPIHRCAPSSSASLSFGIDSSSVVVIGPYDPPVPTVSLGAPSVLGDCSDLFISSSVEGLGGRTASFFWYSSDSSLLSKATIKDGGRSLFLEGYHLSSASSYTFSLAAVNAFGEWSERATVNVTKSAQPLPSVTIEGGAVQDVLSSETSTLIASASMPQCIGETGADAKARVAYKWTVSPDTAKPLYESTSPYLVLPVRTLEPGKTYTFTVTATLTDGSGEQHITSDSVKVVSSFGSLVAKINGASNTRMEFNSLGSVSLDASSSSNPDAAFSSSSLSYSWVCATARGTPCYNVSSVSEEELSLPSSETLGFAASSLALDEYVFTLTVSDGSRQSEAMATVLITASPSLNVLIQSSVARLHSASQVKLAVSLPSFNVDMYSSDVTVEWSVVGNTIDLSNPNVTSTSSAPLLNVNSRQRKIFFETGSITFLARVSLLTTLGVFVGEASITLPVMSSPAFGTFVISPSEGIAYQDTFTLQSFGWETPTSDRLIQYEYFVLVEGGDAHSPSDRIPLSIPQYHETAQSILPPGYGEGSILEVGVIVTSSDGSHTIVTESVRVRSKRFSDEEAASRASDLLTQSNAFLNRTSDLSSSLSYLSSTLDLLAAYGEVGQIDFRPPSRCLLGLSKQSSLSLTSAVTSTITTMSTLIPPKTTIGLVLRILGDLSAVDLTSLDQVIGALSEVLEKTDGSPDATTAGLSTFELLRFYHALDRATDTPALEENGILVQITQAKKLAAALMEMFRNARQYSVKYVGETMSFTDLYGDNSQAIVEKVRSDTDRTFTFIDPQNEDVVSRLVVPASLSSGIITNREEAASLSKSVFSHITWRNVFGVSGPYYDAARLSSVVTFGVGVVSASSGLLLSLSSVNTSSPITFNTTWKPCDCESKYECEPVCKVWNPTLNQWDSSSVITRYLNSSSLSSSSSNSTSPSLDVTTPETVECHLNVASATVAVFQRTPLDEEGSGDGSSSSSDGSDIGSSSDGSDSSSDNSSDDGDEVPGETPDEEGAKLFQVRFDSFVTDDSKATVENTTVGIQSNVAVALSLPTKRVKVTGFLLHDQRERERETETEEKELSFSTEAVSGSGSSLLRSRHFKWRTLAGSQRVTVTVSIASQSNSDRTLSQIRTEFESQFRNSSSLLRTLPFTSSVDADSLSFVGFLCEGAGELSQSGCSQGVSQEEEKSYWGIVIGLFAAIMIGWVIYTYMKPAKEGYDVMTKEEDIAVKKGGHGNKILPFDPSTKYVVGERGEGEDEGEVDGETIGAATRRNTLNMELNTDVRRHSQKIAAISIKPPRPGSGNGDGEKEREREREAAPSTSSVSPIHIPTHHSSDAGSGDGPQVADDSTEQREDGDHFIPRHHSGHNRSSVESVVHQRSSRSSIISVTRASLEHTSSIERERRDSIDSILSHPDLDSLNSHSKIILPPISPSLPSSSAAPMSRGDSTVLSPSSSRGSLGAVEDSLTPKRMSLPNVPQNH